MCLSWETWRDCRGADRICILVGGVDVFKGVSRTGGGFGETVGSKFRLR
jgi:hypothetical protein